MESPALPVEHPQPDRLDDPVRLAALSATDLDSAERAPALHPLVRLAQRALRCPVAQINVLVADRQVPVAAAASGDVEPWQKPVGLDASYCKHIVETGRPMLIGDARVHPILRANRGTIDSGIVAYAGVPLRAPASLGDPRAGRVLGSVCVVDFVPREWNADALDMLRDVSEAVTAELAVATERTELLRAEQEARQSAEQANQAKTQFLTTMSHELRTPLHAIGGYTDLMDLGIHGPVTDEQRVDLSRIRRSQQHLLGLINDVLNLARLESGAVHYERTRVDIASLVARVSDMMAPQAETKGLRFEPLPCTPGVVALADEEKLQQVLVNLLSNAIKFTPPPGTVRIGCHTTDTTVEIHVHDTGIGIPADKHETIFEPFVQVNSELTRVSGGSGLGLAISRDLARGMGGELRVESEGRKGSVFVVEVPKG